MLQWNTKNRGHNDTDFLCLVLDDCFSVSFFVVVDVGLLFYFILFLSVVDRIEVKLPTDFFFPSLPHFWFVCKSCYFTISKTYFESKIIISPCFPMKCTLDLLCSVSKWCLVRQYFFFKQPMWSITFALWNSGTLASLRFCLNGNLFLEYWMNALILESRVSYISLEWVFL